jgi:GntR family transcriptional regulator / MocR family aminotransferase
MFVLNPQSQLPLNTQLYQQIRDHILSGKLPSDSRLPSVRDLAGELSGNVYSSIGETRRVAQVQFGI